MDNLFTKTPSSYFAAIAIAGVVASGYMSFEAGKPIVMALAGDQMPAAKISMVQPVQPVQPGSALGASVKEVSSKVEKVAQANQTKNDQVLGSGDESTTVPVREEFPPAVNLLRNSSFEEDDNGAPRQWNYQYDSNSGNTKTTLEAIRTGAKGLKVFGGGTGNFGLSQPAAKEIERRDYAFSVWVKPVNTDAHTVKLSFWDEVNNKEAKSKTFSFSGTKEWSRLVFQISNKNTWNGKKWFPMITVNGLGSGALYIEDAQLEEASSFTPYHFTGGGATQSHVSILGDGSVEIDAHGNIYPAVNGVGGLGTGSNKFSELRLTKATIDNNGSLTLDGDITVNGNGTFKGAVAFDGTIKSHLIPDQDSTYDLGSTTKKWRWTYTNGVYLQNAETIGNGTNGDIDFTDSGTSNVLVMDLNAAADAVELRNDTEDLRLRAAGNGNLVMRAGDGATNSNVDGNDLFLAAEDAMTLRSATYSLQTSGSTITMTALNSSITMSTGSTEQGFINLRSAGTLTLDTTANRTNIAVLAGGPSSTSLTLRSLNGGIDLSSSSASGSGDIKLRSAGTLHLDTSANNTNILANTGQGRLVATSNNAGITAIQLLATNGGIDISTSGVGGLGELRLRAGGSLKLDTSGNNNNILIDSGTGDLLANIGTGTVTAQDDVIAALGLRASRGGILLSTSNASGNGDMRLLSAGTLQLDTSATNSNILVRSGQGQVNVTSSQAAINSIALLATNGGIDISTSGVGGLGELRLRAGGSLKLDTSGNNNNILVDAGTGDLLTNVGTDTLVAQDDTINAISLSASRGGINLSSSSASGSGDIKLRSAGTLHLDTSANNTNILANTGQGRLVATSNNAGITAIQLLATNGGIDISTSGVGGLGELRLRAGGSLKLDTSGNNNNILIDSGTGDLLANIGTGTVTAQDDVIAALGLRASRGGILLSTSNASGNGDMRLLSAGTLQLDTSATNSNILVRSGTGRFDVANTARSTQAIALLAGNGGIDLSTGNADGNGALVLRSGGSLKLDTSANNNNVLLTTGTGAFTVNAGASTHTYTGAYAVTDTAQINLTSNQAAINAIALLATNGGIDISTSGVGGLGELRLRAGGSLKLDTSGNNNNILIDSGTGDLLANIGTGTVSAVDDTTVALALRATRGGIELSTGNANGNGNMILKSGGTLQLDTSVTGSSILARSGAGQFSVNAGQAASNAISLLATNGGIDLSTSGANGNGNLTLRSAGTLQIDTTASDTNILVIAGGDGSASLALRSDRGGIDISTSSASGAGNLTLRSAGTLQLDTSSANSAVLMRTGTGTLDISSGLVQIRSANDNLTAIRLLADRGGIEISSGTASGNGNVTIKSAGTLTLDTSANNSNIMLRAGTGRIDLSGNTILVNSGAGTLDLSANNTISIVSSTTARVWGETGTLVGRAGTSTRVHGRLCIEGSGDGTSCPAGNDGRLFVNTAGEDALDSGDVFDLAEYYPASEPVDPGTVVIADSNSRATVKMSQYAYQRVLGVVSTSPAIMINDGSFEVGAGTRNYNVAKPLIALVGRVPVKVSSENGSIKVGDRLVASAKAGYAMKATKQGMTLGMALEDMSFENGVTEAKVMTFVNVSWYFPEVVEELEKEYQTAQALGIQANAAAALTAAASSVSAEGSDPSVNVGGSDPAVVTTGVVAGASTVVEPLITVATPPTEFPNLIVTKALTVGKELKVSGKAIFEGEVEVLVDATFGKNVIIVGNLRIGGNLEVAGAVVTNLTAGASIAAGDPVAIGADGKAYRVGAGKAVIGVATLNAAAGEAVKVAVAGKVGNMTGLTTGSRYFVNEAGALTTDGQGGQGLGVAVSVTEMLVQPGVGLPAAAKPVESSSTNIPQSPVDSSNPADVVAPVPTATPTVAPTVTPVPESVPTVVPTVIPTVAPTEAPIPTVTPVL